MVERGYELGLALEARQPRRIALEFRRQDLDGHLTTKFCIQCAIYDAHATSTQLPENLVRTDVETWGPHASGGHRTHEGYIGTTQQ
jgi:hypothetical protein